MLNVNFTAVQWNSWAALVFDYGGFTVFEDLFLKNSLFDPFCHMFSLLSIIKRTKKNESKLWKRYVCPKKKNCFIICTLKIVLNKDLVSDPTKEAGIDRPASYLMLNLRKP